MSLICRKADRLLQGGALINYYLSKDNQVLNLEQLTSSIGNQVGVPHESDGLDQEVVKMNSILLNGRPVYFTAIAFLAELALQIGERVLDFAERHRGYLRAARPPGTGDLSIIIRFRPKEQITSKSLVATLHSEISEVEISCFADLHSAVFRAMMRGRPSHELSAPYPAGS